MGSVEVEFDEIDDGKDKTVEPDTLYHNTRKKIAPVVMSFGFHIFRLVLILVDIVLVIVDLSMPESRHTLEPVSLVISFFFLIDVLLRIYVEGFKVYFRSMLNIMDACIEVITLVVTMIYTLFDIHSHLLKILILLRLFRLLTQKKGLEKATRRMVSENNRRYQKDGFDLDLTYITARIIAMSFPSSGMEALYRNPIAEVARFLDTKHQEHYKVYNLCSEKDYDHEFFHNSVERVLIDDHNVPSLEDMLTFTASVKDWMDADSENIIAIHCNGGKGRTGTMICTWLIDSDQFYSAQKSLDHFRKMRTDESQSSKFQEVETPSQKRYVGYHETMKKTPLPPEPPSLMVKSICIHSIAGVGRGNGSDLKVKIIAKKQLVFQSVCGKQDNCTVTHDMGNNNVMINLQNRPVVQGDVKVMFESSAGLPKGYEDCPFYFWFNTSFVDNNKLILSRKELDNPHKAKTWNLYKEDFGVTMYFWQPGN